MVEVWNRGQYEVLRFELDGENVLDAPLAVEERVFITGFALSHVVSFTRQQEGTMREIRVTAAGLICLKADSTLVLFDDSFRLPTDSAR